MFLLSGFSVLPGGQRDFSGNFVVIRYYAYFWSATQSLGNYAWGRSLEVRSGYVTRGAGVYSGRKYVGASVRCLRD
jgi:uncharacterized protein (TIGR02145 family)